MSAAAKIQERGRSRSFLGYPQFGGLSWGVRTGQGHVLATANQAGLTVKLSEGVIEKLRQLGREQLVLPLWLGCGFWSV